MRAAVRAGAALRQVVVRSSNSDREKQVLRLAAQGLANKQIAGRLGISETRSRCTSAASFAASGYATGPPPCGPGRTRPSPAGDRSAAGLLDQLSQVELLAELLDQPGLGLEVVDVRFLVG